MCLEWKDSPHNSEFQAVVFSLTNVIHPTSANASVQHLTNSQYVRPAHGLHTVWGGSFVPGDVCRTETNHTLCTELQLHSSVPWGLGLTELGAAPLLWVAHFGKQGVKRQCVCVQACVCTLVGKCVRRKSKILQYHSLQLAVDWKQARVPAPQVDQPLPRHCGRGRSPKNCPDFWQLFFFVLLCKQINNGWRSHLAGFVCLGRIRKEEEEEEGGWGVRGGSEDMSRWSYACCSLPLFPSLCVYVCVHSDTTWLLPPSSFFLTSPSVHLFYTNSVWATICWAHPAASLSANVLFPWQSVSAAFTCSHSDLRQNVLWLFIH